MSVPMIESVHFQNFRGLRDTTLHLGRFTLIVGANGSGKSTAMRALQVLQHPNDIRIESIVTSSLRGIVGVAVKIRVNWKAEGYLKTITESLWEFNKDRNATSGPSTVAPGCND